MKRLTALLLCFVLLQSGCSDKTPSEPVASEQEMQQTIRHTTPTTVTTSAATTTVTTATLPEESAEQIAEETADALPEGYDYIVPERIDEKAQIRHIDGTELDMTALREEIGYALDGIDLDNDEDYIRHREWIENYYSGEELEEYRSRNYFEEELYPRAQYIGSDETDWVLIAEYNDQAQLGRYSRLACIKDGKFSYITDGLDIICNWWYSDGQFIASAYENGLCIFDIDNRSIEYIDSDINGDGLCVSWLGIYYINEDYIIFENSVPETSTYLYDRRTGEAKPTTLKSFTDLDDRLEIIGDKLYYLNQRTNECGIYDLISHKYTETDPSEYPAEPAAEDENYTIHCIQNDDTQEVYKAAVIITRHSDGVEKAFDLRKYIKTYDWINWLYSDENWLYISTRYSNIALNFETGQAADINGDLLRLYSSNGQFWCYEQTDRRSVALAEIIPPHAAE